MYKNSYRMNKMQPFLSLQLLYIIKYKIFNIQIDWFYFYFLQKGHSNKAYDVSLDSVAVELQVITCTFIITCFDCFHAVLCRLISLKIIRIYCFDKCHGSQIFISKTIILVHGRPLKQGNLRVSFFKTQKANSVTFYLLFFLSMLLC